MGTKGARRKFLSTMHRVEVKVHSYHAGTHSLKLVQPQHAAACRSTFFLELHMGVLKHAAACRRMPQHAAASQNFHMADFFFHNMSNL